MNAREIAQGRVKPFEADAARGAVSSRRKTIRAVIMRTIIDGSTADIRKSPDWIVLSMQAGDGVDQEATCRTFAEPVAVKFASSPATTSGPRRARDIESVISLKLRQHLGRHKINGRCDIGATTERRPDFDNTRPFGWGAPGPCCSSWR